MGCGCTLRSVDNTLTRWFYRLGHFIGENPYYFLIIPVLVAALGITGFQQIHYESDPEYLFSPINGRAKTERQVVKEYFGSKSNSKSSALRGGEKSAFLLLAVMSRDGDSILRKSVWDELELLDEYLMNMTVTADGEEYTYRNMCATWNEGGSCFRNDILELGSAIESVERRETLLTFPMWFDFDAFRNYIFQQNFGGISINPNMTIDGVKAVKLRYVLNKGAGRRGRLWENTALELLDRLDSEWSHIDVAWLVSQSLEKELENNTNSVKPYIGITMFVMVGFCMLTLLEFDWVKGKPILGFLGVASAMMGTSAAFGAIIYAGQSFIGINMAAPFLMVGIGIDDTFVMLAAWRRSSIKSTVAERMGETFSHAAVSITITSLTDFLSFCVGTITPFPCIKIFCLYTGMAVLGTYLWHITFFGACMAFAGYAENKNKHSILCCLKATPPSKAKGRFFLYRIFCTGGIDRDDPDNRHNDKPHWLMVFFRDRVGALLNIPAVKALVILLFMAYLGGGIWGVTRLKEGLERKNMARSDSYSAKFYERDDKYFREYPYAVTVILTGDLDYSDPGIRMEIEKLMEKFETFKYAGGLTQSWLRSFLAYVDRNKDYYEIDISTEQEFIDTLDFEYLSGETCRWCSDIVFNDNFTKIVASRFTIQTANVSTTNDEAEMLRQVRRIADESPLNVTVHNGLFVFFDQFLEIRPYTIQCIFLAAVCMMIVSLIFIPNPLCALWVGFSIISIEIGIVGYMTFWGINLDAISMINLIMCIGFSVDFSAHISYAYMSCDLDTPAERVKHCLFSLGVPIVQGALSTILGVLALTINPSYIFITFFKIVFMVILFGALHGIILLPVLLSLFGPGSCTRKKKKKVDNGFLPPDLHDKGVPYPYFIGGPTPVRAHLSAPSPRSSNGYGPYRVTNVAHNFATNPSTPVDKDLGLGTSGEDSSESSLSKTGDEIDAAATGNRRTAPSNVSSKRATPVPIMEMYNNAGYVSDDEWDEQRYRRQAAQPPRDYRDYREPRVSAYNNTQNNMKGGYIGEMKFP